MMDSINNNSNLATSDYDFIFILENGTKLNISNINEDFYLDIYVPIIDLIISNFNYSIYFDYQGYDIYDKKGSFYNDICSPAYLNKSDITLEDRKKDIYPNNVRL